MDTDDLFGSRGFENNGYGKNIRRFTRKFMKTPVGKKHPQDVFGNSD